MGGPSGSESKKTVIHRKTKIVYLGTLSGEFCPTRARDLYPNISPS